MASMAHQTIQNHTLLKDIRPAMRGVDIEVIVLQQESDTIITPKGEMINKYLIADKSGVMILKTWGATGGMFRSGDILRICGVVSKYSYGSYILEISRQGKTQRLGQDTFPFVEGPNFSQQVEPGSDIKSPRQSAATVKPILTSSYLQPSKQPQTMMPSFIPLNTPTHDSLHQTNARPLVNFGPGWTSGLDNGQGVDETHLKPSDTLTDGLKTNIKDPRKRRLEQNRMDKERLRRQKVEYNELV